MSDTEKPVFVLPEPIEKPHEGTWTCPNVLHSESHERREKLTVEEGGDIQCQFKTRIEFAYDLQPDRPVFRIVTQNQINFARAIIQVINDELTMNDGPLVASNPTASEFNALSGKEVVTYFNQRIHAMYSRPEAAGKTVYQITTTTMLMP